jgi:hypothetical protein
VGSRRSLRIAALVAALAAAVAAVILLNLALLGYAQPRNDPVGKLSPLAIVSPSPAPSPQPSPARTTPTTTRQHDDHDD